MEETRISRMYLTLFLGWLGALPRRIIGGQWLRSSVTWIVLALTALLAIAVAIHEKGRGDLHRLKTGLGAEAAPPAIAEVPRPGGQAPLVLSRGQAAGAFSPEFLSVTLLPGRGLDVLQITAFIPAKGSIALLASRSVEDAAKTMTGSGDDLNGQANLLTGGAFELPWAGRLSGSPLPGGLAVGVLWNGRTLTLPALSPQGAEGGLFLKQAATSTTPSTLPDGSVSQATFDAGDFDHHWPSSTRVQTTVVLTGRNLDLSVTAKNIGTSPEPMGIGWRPHFALTPIGHTQAKLRVPSTVTADARTGRLLSVTGTQADFSSPNGTLLRPGDFDQLYVQLKTGLLGAGPEIELRNPEAGYGLRIIALTSNIKAIHVTASAGQPSITLDPQTNYDDPLGHQWPQDSPGALTILKPGESLEWKLRLEIFPLTSAPSQNTLPFTSLPRRPSL